MAYDACFVIMMVSMLLPSAEVEHALCTAGCVRTYVGSQPSCRQRLQIWHGGSYHLFGLFMGMADAGHAPLPAERASSPSRASGEKLLELAGSCASKAPSATRCAKRGRSSGAKTRRPKGSAAPVTCTMGHVLAGGCLSPSTAMALNTVKQDGKDWVKATNREAWLCIAASGKGRGQNPLSRTTLLSDLKELMTAALPREGSPRAPARDPMMALGLDDPMMALGLDGPVVYSAIRRKCVPTAGPKARAKGKAKGKAKADPCVSRKVTLSLPGHIRGSNGPEKVDVLTRPNGRSELLKGIYIEVSAVPWLVETLAAQVRRGGVSFTPAAASIRKPWFSVRDRAWVARAKAEGAGEPAKRYFTVPRFIELPNGKRRSLTLEEFQREQAAMLLKAEQWQREVQGDEP